MLNTPTFCFVFAVVFLVEKYTQLFKFATPECIANLYL